MKHWTSRKQQFQDRIYNHLDHARANWYAQFPRRLHGTYRDVRHQTRTQKRLHGRIQRELRSRDITSLEQYSTPMTRKMSTFIRSL